MGLRIHVIYIRITENLVLLLNDNVVKLFFSNKTSQDLSRTQPKLVMMS